MTTAFAKLLTDMNTAEITVKQLRWVVAHADNDATLAEALQAFADNEHQEAEDLKHADRTRAYDAYLKRREAREREHAEQAGNAAKQAAIAAREISRDDAYHVYAAAANDEKIRFELRSPRLEFTEWVDAGEPDVYEIRLRGPQAKTGAVNG